MAVNVLLSYAMNADVDLRGVRARMPCGRIMVDSGAFTAHTTGKTITLDGYAAFLERGAGAWDHAVTLDVIGDPVASARNTRKLHERGYRVMPVFTRGDRIPEFDAMVRDTGFVCVGGLVGLQRSHPQNLRARVELLQRRAAELGGGIHALGVGSTPNLRAARPYSADSAAIVQVFRYGRVAYFNGRNVVSVKLTDTKRLRADREWIRAHGIDLGELVERGRHKGLQASLFRRMSLAYVVADEVLRHHRVTAPQAGLPDGTVLYNSVAPDQVPELVALNAAIHSPAPPPLWRRFGIRHVCDPGPAAAPVRKEPPHRGQ